MALGGTQAGPVLTVTLRALGALIVAVVVGCSGTPAASPSPTAAPIPSPTAAPTATPTAPPTPSPTPAARTYTFDDGALTIEVPPGALPDGVELSATQRGPEDRPPELADVQIRGTFYSLEPDGLTFAQPLTITRRVAVADIGLDLATDGLPIITLALRTSDGQWEWLAEQAIGTDGDFIYISGKASHTSTLMGFGGTEFAQNAWTPPGLQVPVGGTFALNGTVTAPLEAPSPPVVGDLHLGGWAAGTADPWPIMLSGGGGVPGREPFTHTGILSGQGEAFNSTGWDDLPPEQRGNAMPRIYQEVECVQPGEYPTFVGYEVVGLGAGSEFYARLDLDPPSTTLVVGGDLMCIEGTGADIVTPTSGCLIVVHTARGTFISYLRLLIGFGVPQGSAEFRRVEVTIEGANDDEPVLAEPLADDLFDYELYEALLGLRGAGPKTLKELLVTDSDGMVHDLTSDLASLVGGSTFDVPFPGEPTFGTCPAP